MKQKLELGMLISEAKNFCEKEAKRTSLRGKTQVFPSFLAQNIVPKHTFDIIYIILILFGAYARPSLSRTPVHGQRLANLV